MSYGLVVGAPTQDDYLRLRIDTGLSPKQSEAAARGLPHTLYAVMIEHQGRAVGMGRIIGDGGLFYQVVDIAVEPAHQGQGLGKRIMGALVEWLKATAPKSAYVSLIADGEANRLYSQFGFEPTAPRSIGMAMLIR